MFGHRFDVGTMLRVFELIVKNPAFAQQKNSSNARVFFEELWRFAAQWKCLRDNHIFIY